MSFQDPIADMLTRIRNAQQRKMLVVDMPFSEFKAAILQVLKDEGYVKDYQKREEGSKNYLSVTLKYYQGRPVIDMLKRVSRPGCRVYKGLKKLPKVLGGIGVAVVSTPSGVMSDRAARKLGQGGEVICYIS
jgi:small subunit ribosomal protein S8